MKQNTYNLLSAACYVGAFVIYFIELSIFGNAISTATSQSGYATATMYLLIAPIVLLLFGVFIAFKGFKAQSKKIWGKVLMGLGILLVLFVLLESAIGISVNGSEALSKLQFFA